MASSDQHAVRTGEGNEIMERMIVAERRQMAQQLGVRVSDLEEALNLSLAMGASKLDDGEQVLHQQPQPQPQPEQLSTQADVEDEMDEGVDMPAETVATATDSGTTKQQVERSKWYLLPNELADIILEILGCPDMLGIIMCVARSNPFRPSQYVYKQIVENIYPKQFGSATLKINLRNWGGSWKTMLIHRPRIRTNGFYTLKTLYTKPPTNDSFDDPKIYGSIETAYFRHFRFFDHGLVLYSPSLVDPWKMVEILGRAKPVEKQVFLGSYAITKGRMIHASFRLHYCEMRFELEILDGCESYSNYPGKHSVLRILKHSQILPAPGAGAAMNAIVLNQPTGPEYEFPLPINVDCRFWREWSYHSGQMQEPATSAYAS